MDLPGRAIYHASKHGVIDKLVTNKKSIYWLQLRLTKGFRDTLGNSVLSCKEPQLRSHVFGYNTTSPIFTKLNSIMFPDAKSYYN